MVKAHKISYIGISDVPAWIVSHVNREITYHIHEKDAQCFVTPEIRLTSGESIAC
jgi:hypothetical protein